MEDKIAEMLAIPREFRHLVKSSMSTREIRKLNKSLIADVDNDEENEIVAAPQLNESDEENEIVSAPKLNESDESEVLVITNEDNIKHN